MMNPFDGSGSPRHEADGADSLGAWSRLSAWMECVCVVTFDLELGQAIEVSLASLASFIIHHSSEPNCSDVCRTVPMFAELTGPGPEGSPWRR